MPSRSTASGEGSAAATCIAMSLASPSTAGPEAELRHAVRPRPDAVTIDAERGTVLPGFVDAHTHLPFAGWREREFDERLRGATYSEIAARGGGILSTVARTREATEDELVALLQGRLDELLALGTTTVEAKSGYGLSFDDELKQLGAIEHPERFYDGAVDYGWQKEQIERGV